MNNPGAWTSLDGLPNTVFNTTSGILNLDNLTKDIYSFQYIVSNDAPCGADTAFAFIEISELANIDFNSNFLEGCSPLTVDFNDLTQVNGTKDFSWSIDGMQVGQNQNMTYTFDEVRCYDVSLTIKTDNFCTAKLTESNLICINPDPIAAFDFKPSTIFSDDPVVYFNNESVLNFQNEWDFEGLGQSIEANPTFSFPLGKEMDYEVKLTVTSEKGCVDSTFRVVSVRDQTIFYVPNAFTPDGDDYNNVFLPIMTVGIDPELYKLEVFNRWGEKLFESNDYDFGWDGTYGNRIVKEGMYVWKITFTEMNTDNVITESGSVVLIR